jgi:hypothetical protein
MAGVTLRTPGPLHLDRTSALYTGRATARHPTHQSHRREEAAMKRVRPSAMRAADASLRSFVREITVLHSSMVFRVRTSVASTAAKCSFWLRASIHRLCVAGSRNSLWQNKKHILFAAVCERTVANGQSSRPHPRSRTTLVRRTTSFIIVLIPNISCPILAHDGHRGRMERLKWLRDPCILTRAPTDQTHC